MRSARLGAFVIQVRNPRGGAVVSGANVPRLASAAAGDRVESVTFVLSRPGGSGLPTTVIGHASSTPYGWLDALNSESVANGAYEISCVSIDTSGRSSVQQSRSRSPLVT